MSERKTTKVSSYLETKEDNFMKGETLILSPSKRQDSLPYRKRFPSHDTTVSMHANVMTSHVDPDIEQYSNEEY
jgi:hypothetical protein